VVQIGATTCGKPVGMYGKSFCEQIILPIEFQSVNALDQGDYFDGLTADCNAFDDLNNSFADINEDMFNAAIYHMNNSQCRPTTLKNSGSKGNVSQTNKAINWYPQAQVN